MNDVTAEGSRLITYWLQAIETVDRAKSGLSRAQTDEMNAQEALAKWLMPTDMKPGEKIAVWHGDSLFQVELAPRERISVPGGEVHTDYVPKVTIRTRGKHFSDLRRAG